MTHSLGFLMLDIDHFKKVNDTFGHPAGDKVLAGLSGFLQKEIRHTDVAARMGGEEFVVLLPEAELKGVIAAAEKFRLGIAEASKEMDAGSARHHGQHRRGARPVRFAQPGLQRASLTKRTSASTRRSTPAATARTTPASDPNGGTEFTAS